MMRCSCGNEITETSLMKVGCLAFRGYICDKCGKGWYNNGLEAFGWDDLRQYDGKGVRVTDADMEDLLKEIVKRMMKP